MKYILFFLLLSVSATAQTDHICDQSKLEIIDSVYFKGYRFMLDGTVPYCQSNVVYPEWGMPEHEWIYEPTIEPFTGLPKWNPLVYVIPPECPSDVIKDYKRICEKCLRHERYKKVQHYEKRDVTKSRYEELKSQIQKQ